MNFNVNEDLKVIREMLELSQEKMANELELDVKTINRIENGYNYPNADTIEKIYDYAYKHNIKLNNIKEMFYKEETTNKLLFHGTKTMIDGDITIEYGRDNSDFGKGFYCGESIEQTISFISRYPNSSFYILSFDDKELKSTTFTVNQEWMLAVAYFRGKLNDYKDNPKLIKIVEKVKNVDYIYAPIADNRMFTIIDNFIDGLITDEQCKHSLAATNLGNQYVFLNDKATSRLQILERCYISNLEREKYLEIKKTEVDDGDNKVKLAMIKYKNQGKYIEEILK